MRLLRTILLYGLLLNSLTAAARGGKDAFLAQRAVPFARAQLAFPDSIRIWAFGALHGAARTEDTELVLLEKLLARRDSVWYFPETDFSTACYFEAYLHSGDDSLLRRLVDSYGLRVPQERTVEVCEKWRRLRRSTQDKHFRVVGLDPVCSPDFALQYLLDSMRDEAWPYREPLHRLSAASDEAVCGQFGSLLSGMAADYVRRPDYYAAQVRDTASFGYVIRDLQRMGEKREQGMVRNYRELNARYDFRRGVQVVRMGVGHILKGAEDGWRPFLMRLVEQGLYRPTEICTVQAFLTRSRVLWNAKSDAAGAYAGFTTKGGWGISDCWRERFRGIRHLKRNRRGDMTFFDLRGPASPYADADCLDLVVCRRPFGRTERCPEGAVTLDYLDAAVLIRGSRAAQPIDELDNN